MKNKLVEALYSFLGILGFSIATGTLFLVGVLLMPVVFLLVWVLAIREMITWKRWQQLHKADSTNKKQQREEGMIKYMFVEAHKQAA